jgi:hypothetical protein
MLLDHLDRNDFNHFVSVLEPEVAKTRKAASLQKKPLEAVCNSQKTKPLVLIVEQVEKKMKRDVFVDLPMETKMKHDELDDDSKSKPRTRSFDSGLAISTTTGSPTVETASSGISPICTPESAKSTAFLPTPGVLSADTQQSETLSYAQATSQLYKNVPAGPKNA